MTNHPGESGLTRTEEVLPERFANPGEPPHVPRRGDDDPKAARRAERQVAALFTV